MAERTHKTVVRNHPYKRDGIGIRERHNERKNKSYSNPDIVPERTHLNTYYIEPNESYLKTLDRMLKEGTISDRGLKKDAKVFGELVFDVNSLYFEDHGRYDFAQDFFFDAYNFAVQELGKEYILSAVMHADEINRSLSKELGWDVYHYHLHVIYIPIVALWSSR